MLLAAEELFGPYEWIGSTSCDAAELSIRGMENRADFVTPSLLAGDRFA